MSQVQQHAHSKQQQRRQQQSSGIHPTIPRSARVRLRISGNELHIHSSKVNCKVVRKVSQKLAW